MKRWILFVLLFVLPTDVWAQDIPERPTTAGYVFDYQEVIDDDIEAELNHIAQLLQQEEKMELMLVTVDTIGDLAPYEYGMKFFREWSIGDTELDNGMLIYVTTKMGENKNVVRISTGYGLEGDYPDSETNALIQDYMKPHLVEGNFTAAFANVVEAIREREAVDYTWENDMAAIMPVAAVDTPAEESEEVYEEDYFAATIFFLFILGIIGIILYYIGKFVYHLFRKVQGSFYNYYYSKTTKDIRTKGYKRYEEKKEEARIERERKEEERRALIAAGIITESRTSSSDDNYYSSDSSYSSSNDDSYSYGGGDSGGGGSDDRF